MSDSGELAPLLGVLRDLIAWFEAEKVRGVVIGGLAASLLGRPRLTRDIDVLVLINEGHWGKFMAAGERHGFGVRRDDALFRPRRTSTGCPGCWGTKARW